VSINSIELISLDGIAKTREGAINEAAEMLIRSGAVTPGYRESMFARESSVSTYMGNYLAIPHGTLESQEQVLSSALAIIRYPQPIMWGEDQVRFVIGIAGKDGTHLEALGRIAEIFSNLETVEEILAASSEDQVRSIFSRTNNS
jgi:mannitol/fructose-specific phosphotransferase system IIA component